MTDKRPNMPEDEPQDGSATPPEDSSSSVDSQSDSTVDSIEELIDGQRSTSVTRKDPRLESTEPRVPDDAEKSIPFGIPLNPEQGTLETIDLGKAQSDTGIAAENDETVQIAGNQPDKPRSIVISGTGKGPQNPSDESTDILDGSETPGSSSIDLTMHLGSVDPQAGTVIKRPSPDAPLDNRDIQQTINPRELSDEDAALWNSLLTGTSLGSSKGPRGPSTQIRPAIERTITETNLQIRRRDVSTPRHDPEAPSDYRLVRLLGKGGMGNVFVAKQASLDRLIALKVIKPLDDDKRNKLKKQGRLTKVEQERRHQFLSEAVVTGDLDHPNIVPIYDIAVAGDDTLFYAMKRVVGTPWSKVIHEKSLDENLDILLKVADAIGFAHTRSVVHRDIKPENVMLGDFGVVLVMDWGLALAKPEFEKIDSIAHTAGLGGTPAFMAPEMAKGPIQRIGPASDIYLLGATLFMIITGKAPHQAESVSKCIKAVAVNEIAEVDQKHRGELMNIALKAMATNPTDRYSNIAGFQKAIREYRSHSESISLAAIADRNLKAAIAKSDYEHFSRATYGYEQAVSLWGGNQQARNALQETRIAHAEAALRNEDYDLGLSLLDEARPEHEKLVQKLRAGARDRDERQSRLTLFRRLAAAMLAFILIGGSIGLFEINRQRQAAIASADLAAEEERKAKESEKNAIAAREEAEDRRKQVERERQKVSEEKEYAELQECIKIAAADDAERQRDIAEHQEAVANYNAMLAAKNEKTAKENAERARANAEDADRQRNDAIRERANAEYEAYLSRIGLAKARVEQNEFDDARKILKDLRGEKGAKNLGWEWHWLWQQANQSDALRESKASLIDVSVSPTKNRAITLAENGSVDLISLPGTGRKSSVVTRTPKLNSNATSLATSPNSERIAIGTADGDIEVWDARLTQMIRRLRGHEQRVNDLLFLDGKRVVSCSRDRTIRIWDLTSEASGKPIATCWHIAAVRRIAIADGDNQLLIGAVSDSASGRVAVWDLANLRKPKRVGEFRGHTRPVSSVAITNSGKLAASADVTGKIYLWRPLQASKTNYEASVGKAIRLISGKLSKRSAEKRDSQPSVSLVDKSLVNSDSTRLVSTVRQLSPGSMAHADVVEAIRFSRDESHLISASDDYTIKLWNVPKQQLLKTLRGHGGWVTNVRFFPGVDNRILSISKDGTVRSWNTDSYLDEKTLVNRPDRESSDANRQAKPHADEIWSARFDPTGTRIVSASRDHTARILGVDRETMTFREIAQLQDSDPDGPRELVEGTPFRAMSAVVDRVHGRLFVGSADSTVRIWDLALGTEIGQLSGTGLNNSLALSRNGRLLLTGASSPEFKAILWGIDPGNNKSPKVIYRLKGHEEAVTAFAISSDGRMIFTGDRTGIGWLWNTMSGQKIGKPIEDSRGYRINAASFSPDGSELLIAADDQQLTRIDVRTRQRVRRYSHDGLVTQFSLSADGTRAVTVSELNTERSFATAVRVWNLKTGTEQILARETTPINKKRSVKIPRKRFLSAQFGGQDRYIALSSSEGESRPGRLQIIDYKSNGSKSGSKTFEMPMRLGRSQVAMPLTEEHLLTLNGDSAFLWNLRTLSHQKSYRAHAALTQASFSFDGRYVATASRSVKIWDARTGESVGKLESPHRGPIRSVDFSPVATKGSSYRFATTGDDGWVRSWSWNPSTSQFKQEFEAALQNEKSTTPLAGQCVRFSPDGKSLLGAGAGGIARIWVLQNPKSPSRYGTGKVGTFTCGDFSADGRWVVIGGNDRKARLFEVVAPGQSNEKPILFEGHSDQIEDVAILQSESTAMRVLTASLDKSTRVWDPRLETEAQDARELLTLRKHRLGVTSVDVTKDGELVMTASRDGTVILWPGSPSTKN